MLRRALREWLNRGICNYPSMLGAGVNLLVFNCLHCEIQQSRGINNIDRESFTVWREVENRAQQLC